MQKLLYYLIVKPLSLIPLPALYFLTTPAYWLLAYVVQYRGRVVINNLKNAFPEKSKKELLQIRRRFYRHFLDQLLESLKMLSLSCEKGVRRFKMINPEILDPIYQEGRHIAAVIGHYNNWEYTAMMNAQMQHQFLAIYSPLKNKFMDRLVYQARSTCGAQLVSKHDVGLYIRKKDLDPFLLLFVADQSPRWRSKLHWTTFLNQETAVATGTERYAQMLNMPVVFGHIKKIKRGHYEIELELLTADPQKEPEGRITELHVKALEKDILQAPEYWLWTHKRWKKKLNKNKGK